MKLSRPSAAAGALRRSTIALALALCGLGTTCDQCAQIGDPRRGNIDRVSDVVIVNAEDGRSYAVLANPELLHLRVLDLTEDRFVRAPNRYFPLSVPVGDATRALAVAIDATTTAADPRRVFALDAADDTVFVVRTATADGPVFDVTAALNTPRAPAGVAAVRLGDVTVVAVTAPELGVVELIAVDDAAVEVGRATIDLRADLGEGARGDALPSAIVADALGQGVFVADGARGEVTAIELAVSAGAPAATLVRHVDVGGPVSRLTAGVVDVGDGLAPVVLALRSDEPAAMLVRGRRAGFREDRYALLGGAGLPVHGVAAYVPDARASGAPVTVCCRGLSDERVAAGEASDAFATVSLIDGRVLMLQLAATRLDGFVLDAGRRVVRLVDDDAAPPSPPEGVDINADAELWVPAAGGEARRPTIAIATVDNLGTPPFVGVVEAGASLLLEWEGELARARSLSGTFSSADAAFVTDASLPARDVRPGDLAVLVPEGPAVGCAAEVIVRVRAVAGSTATLARVGDEPPLDPALSESESLCLSGGGAVRLTVRAADAFIVTEGAKARGRLRFVEATEPDGSVELPGARLTARVSAAGVPLRGSKLAVPLDARVTTLGVNLPDVSSAAAAALVPTGIAGGTVVIPDAANEGGVVSARRVVLTSAGVNGSSGLPFLFTADEGETSVGRVEALR